MAKSSLRIGKSTSRSSIDNKKENPNGKFSYPPIQTKTDTNESKTKDLSDYRQPRSRDIMDNVMSSHGAGNVGIQAKSTIGQPNNKQEQEADQVASQVVNQITNPASVQRQEQGEEKLQIKGENNQVNTVHKGLTSVTERNNPPMIQRGGGKLDPGAKVPTMDKLVKDRFKETKSQQINDKVKPLQNQYLKQLIQQDIQGNGIKEIITNSKVLDKDYEGTLFLPALWRYESALSELLTKILAQNDGVPNLLDILKFNIKQNEIQTILGNNYFVDNSDENVTVDLQTVNRLFAFYRTMIANRVSTVYSPENELNQQVAEFLESRSDVTMPQKPLTKGQRAGFSAALRQMPTIQLLLKVHKTKGAAPEQGILAPQWKDGGYLNQKIESSNLNDKNKPFKKLQRNLYDSGDFMARVVNADKFVRSLVEPELLGQLNRPKIIAHLQNENSREGGFRAFCRTEQAEVHVAQDQEVAVIVHEIMHYIEHNLPDNAWHDIHIMMRTRHQQSAKDPTKISSGGLGMREEGRYAGDYKATGKYTSSAYDDGDTEVTSMTTQFLSDPKEINKMLDKDPQQTAIILRGLKPLEYQATNALRLYDQFLPH